MADHEYDEQSRAIADVVRSFCEDRGIADVFSDDGEPGPTWRELGELGVLSLGTPEGGGGAAAVAAVMEEFGAAALPGPLPETVFASRLLDNEDFGPIAAGHVFVTVALGQFVPYGKEADLCIQTDGTQAWTATFDPDASPSSSRVWSVGRMTDAGPRQDATDAASWGDMAVAAYLVGAARRMIEAATAHAASRQQFGRPIGDFQAVSFQLADADTRVAAATALARRAAVQCDGSGRPRARHASAVARMSATRACFEGLEVAHQVLGALGFTVEGPLSAIRDEIARVSEAAPGLDAARSVIARRGKVVT